MEAVGDSKGFLLPLTVAERVVDLAGAGIGSLGAVVTGNMVVSSESGWYGLDHGEPECNATHVTAWLTGSPGRRVATGDSEDTGTSHPSSRVPPRRGRVISDC